MKREDCRKQVRLTREGADVLSSSLAAPSKDADNLLSTAAIGRVTPSAGVTAHAAVTSSASADTERYYITPGCGFDAGWVVPEGQKPIASFSPLPDREANNRSLAEVLADYASGSDSDT